MVNKDSIPGRSAPSARGTGAGFSLHPLHEAALRIAEYGLTRPKERTRDLVALLMCHGARAWRSTQPPADVHLHVTVHRGRQPVHLRLR